MIMAEEEIEINDRGQILNVGNDDDDGDLDDTVVQLPDADEDDDYTISPSTNGVIVDKRNKTKRAILLCALTLMSSAAILLVVFGSLGVAFENNDGQTAISGVTMAVNEEAIALADCLAEERERLVENGGSERRGLRGLEGRYLIQRPECEKLLAEAEGLTLEEEEEEEGDPSSTQEIAENTTSLEQPPPAKTPTHTPTNLPTKTPTSEEYEQLVQYSESVVEYWTSIQIQDATPMHKTIDDIEFPLLNLEEFQEFNEVSSTNNANEDMDLPALVNNDPWNAGGDVMESAGRLLFTSGETNYRCSATAITDGDESNGRSLVLTAAHCLYDDNNKVFHTNFMFIPEQDDGGLDVSDFNCTNDKHGCWIPSFAVVDADWATSGWPSNIPADYGFLVVSDAGSHNGPDTVNDALDNHVEALDVSFDMPGLGETGYALGYPGDRDVATNPSDFRYCRQILQDRPQRGGFLLDGCGLRGGASGGPWIQNIDANGRGEVISVNSYGPGGQSALYHSYMGGPILHDNSAQCLYEKAMTVPDTSAGSFGGIIVTYVPGDCAASTFVNNCCGRPTSKPTSSPSVTSTVDPLV